VEEKNQSFAVTSSPLLMSFGGMFDGAAGSGVFSYDATGGGGTGMHNPSRLIPAPPLPKPGGFGATGLSLGLVDSLRRWLL